MKGKNHASKVYMCAHSYSMCSCMRGREREERGGGNKK